jgi:putative transposase
MREVMNAILHIGRMGAQWDSLPRELPLRSNVDEDFKRWREDGARQRLMAQLRRAARRHLANSEEPDPGIDRQTVRTTEKGGSAGTARAKESLAESGTPRWTPGDFRWPRS